MRNIKYYFAESGRGLDDCQIEALKIADVQDGFLKGMLSELKNPQTDIWLGIRNGYFNLYVEGASIGKITIDDGKIKIHKKYLGESFSGYKTLLISDSHYNFKKVCDNIKMFHTNSSQRNLEKKFQQRLVISNNFADSPWYCVDMEYAMEAGSFRFDIIAISRKPMVEGEHRLLIIEVKVGRSSFGIDNKLFPTKPLTNSIERHNLGSGVLGHFTDFVNYKSDKDYDCGDGFKGRFTRLRGEMVNILKNYQSLGLLPKDIGTLVETMSIDDICDEPKMVFLIYSGDVTRKQIEDSFRLYVGGEACEGISRNESKYTIVKAWDEAIVKQVFRDSIKCVFREGKDINVIKDRQPIFEDEEISEVVQIF